VTAGVLVVLLCAALVHASWNLLVKAGRDTTLRTAGVYGGAGLLAVLTLPFVPAPARASWPFLACSTGVELLYGMLLAATYRVGDLSHAYPLMRGTAPLLVAAGSAALLGEHLSPAVWTGIALVSAGIFSLVLEVRRQPHSARATRLALLNAVLIGVYTTIDGLGVRASEAPVSYSLWLAVTTGVPWLVWGVMRGRTAGGLRRWLPVLTLGGVGSLTSYTLVLWAMTRTPVAAVAAVRETSIVFATVLGSLVLRERVTPVRALAACAIAAGVWAIRAHAG
jgi:drug/metabolite transporter (DMT)-like permease